MAQKYDLYVYLINSACQNGWADIFQFYFMVTNSAKRLFRDLSEFISKLVEHRAQSPVRVIQQSGFSLKIVKFPQVL